MSEMSTGTSGGIVCWHTSRVAPGKETLWSFAVCRSSAAIEMI